MWEVRGCEYVPVGTFILNASHRLYDRVALEASYIHVHRLCTSHCISQDWWDGYVVYVCVLMSSSLVIQGKYERFYLVNELLSRL